MDVNALAAKLSDPAANVRAEAAEALAHLAEGAQAAAVPLVQAMGDADEDVRNWALAALESLGPPRFEDAPALSKLAADPRLDVAYWAVMLLGRFGGMSVPAQNANCKRIDRGARKSRGNCRTPAGGLGIGQVRRCRQLGPRIALSSRRLWRSSPRAAGEGSDREFEMTFDVQA